MTQILVLQKTDPHSNAFVALPYEPDNTHYFTRLNVITFQLKILCCLFLENISENFYKMSAGEETIKCVNELRSTFYDYNSVKDYLSGHTEFHKLIEEISAEDFYWDETKEISELTLMPIHLIIGVTYLNMDDLLDKMMTFTFFSGLTFDFTYADGNLLSPIEFLLHDLDHAVDYLRGIQEHRIPQSLLTAFYIHLKHNKDNLMRNESGSIVKDQYGCTKFYRVKLFFFLIVHELSVNCFVESRDRHGRFLGRNGWPDAAYMMGNNGLREYFSERNYAQFLDDNDIALIIPKRLREIPQDTPMQKDIKINFILAFLKNCAKDFVELRNEWWIGWLASKQTAGRRKRRRTKNKRNKRNKKRKTNRRN